MISHADPFVSLCPNLSTERQSQSFVEPGEFAALAKRVADRVGHIRGELGPTQLVEAMSSAEREAACAYLEGVCELASVLNDLTLHQWGTQRLADVREAIARAAIRERQRRRRHRTRRESAV